MGLSGRREGVLSQVNLRFESGILGLELGVTGLNLGGIEIVQGQGLAQDKEVFGFVVAGQGFGDVGFRFVAVVITEFGQGVGVMFTSHNGSDDLQAGFAGNITDHLG